MYQENIFPIHFLEEHICSIFFTSGSSGYPKLVAATYNNLKKYLFGRFMSFENYFGIPKKHSNILVASKFTFDPHFGDIIFGLCYGFTITVPNRDLITTGKLKQILLYIHENLIYVENVFITLTPSQLKLSFPQLQFSCIHKFFQSSYPKVRGLYFGGEMLPLFGPTVFSSSEQLKLFNIYGLTEGFIYQMERCINQPGELRDLQNNKLSINISSQLLSFSYKSLKTGLVVSFRNIKKKSCTSILLFLLLHGSSLNPLLGTYLKLLFQYFFTQIFNSLLNKKSLEISGEIFFIGEQICNSNKSSIPFLTTGDYATFLFFYPKSDRFILQPVMRFIGRKDTQIKVNGVRRNLAEISSSVRVLDFLISDVITCHRKKGEINLIIVCIELTTEFLQRMKFHKTNETDKYFGILPKSIQTLIRYFCEKTLPGGLQPTGFIWFESLASFQSINGKINLRELESVAFSEFYGHEKSYCTPFTSLEHIVSELWSDTLGIPIQYIEKHHSFISHGGDSLLAQKVSSSLVNKLFSLSALNNRVFKLSQYNGELNQANDNDMLVFSPQALLKASSLSQFCTNLRNSSYMTLPDRQPSKEHLHTAFSQSEFLIFSLIQDNFLSILHPFFSSSNIQSYVKEPIFKVLRVGGLVNSFAFLNYALLKLSLDSFVELLALGCNPWCPGKEGSLPIHTLAGFPLAKDSQRDYGTLLELLLTSMKSKRKKSFNPLIIRDGRKQTPLHHAARSGNLQALQLLLLVHKQPENKAKYTKQQILHFVDRFHRTPLHWAILNKHPNCIYFLVTQGANVHFSLRPTVASRSTHLTYETPCELARRHNVDLPFLKFS
eukprot:snap_masked-scaffold_34-processed-gene-0.56-mRNA-1 protein AED:1.00 eAED:1.00 QI:0/0/0/0/1/1/2/0/832